MFMILTTLNVDYLYTQHGTLCCKKKYKIPKQTPTLMQLRTSKRTHQQNTNKQDKIKEIAKQTKSNIQLKFSAEPRLAFKKKKKSIKNKD